MAQNIEVKTLFFTEGISKLVDGWANSNNISRHNSAQSIISASVDKPIKVSFIDSKIIAHLPSRFVKEWRNAGRSDEAIIKHCVITGLAKVSNAV